MENRDRAGERPEDQSSERHHSTQQAADHLLRAALSFLAQKDATGGAGEESRPEALDYVRQALASLGYEATIRPVGSTEPFAPLSSAPDDESIPPGKELFYRLLRDRGMSHQGALAHIALVSGQKPPPSPEVNESFRSRLLEAGMTPDQADEHLSRISGGRTGRMPEPSTSSQQTSR